MATLISRLPWLDVLLYDFFYLILEILILSSGTLSKPQIFKMVIEQAMDWAIYWAMEWKELAD